jgi:sn-glycerol 3-phosphate transport system permease protein
MPEAALATAPGTGPPQAPSPPSPARRRRRRLRHRILPYTLLTVGAVFVLFPLYTSVVFSLERESDLAKQPPQLFPFHPQWSNYSTAWNAAHMGTYMRNSAIVTLIIVVGQVVTSVLAAYAFAFLRFPFRRTLFVVFLATLMIPFEVTVITNLETSTSLHLFNTLPGLAIPFLATGFGTFLVRQAFLQIPRDLREAAALDGYGHWRFMVRVAVPLARPAVAAVAVFSFLAAWNQYLWPLLATNTKNNFTVQIGLKSLVSANSAEFNVATAGALIAFIPLVILLIAFQKQLVRGLTAGAVK